MNCCRISSIALLILDQWYCIWGYLIYVFYAQNLSVKKINRLKIVSITSNTILLMCTPLKHPMENYFPPTQRHFFSSPRNYFHLWKSLLIYDHLWESFLSHNHLWKSFFICQNLFSSECTYFFLWEFYDHLQKSFRIYDHLSESIFLSLYENKQVYEYHHLKQIFYHQNTIIIFCWFCIFHFLFFTLNSFHFVPD